MAFSTTARTDQQVECPRCGLHRSLFIHRITSSDAQECPRCLDKDGVEVRMDAHQPHRIAKRQSAS